MDSSRNSRQHGRAVGVFLMSRSKLSHRSSAPYRAMKEARIGPLGIVPKAFSPNAGPPSNRPRDYTAISDVLICASPRGEGGISHGWSRSLWDAPRSWGSGSARKAPVAT